MCTGLQNIYGSITNLLSNSSNKATNQQHEASSSKPMDRSWNSLGINAMSWKPTQIIEQQQNSMKFKESMTLLTFVDVWWYLLILVDICWYLLLFDYIVDFCLIFVDIWWYLLIFVDICYSLLIFCRKVMKSIQIKM